MKRPSQLGKHERGVASLLVVMMLLFVVSLTAAYASRNLIFEQKTSANQARSTLAFEAAEAGVEWTLAQLNGGIVNGTCGNTSATSSFQRRYLRIGADGFIDQQPRATSTAGSWWPTCVSNGTDWTCTCPDSSNSDPSPLPTGPGTFPAFRIWLATPEASAAVTSPWGPPAPPRAGFLPISSVGCTRLATETSDKCLDFLPSGQTGDGLSAVRATLVLRSGLAVPPAAPLTARLDVVPANVAAKLVVINTEPASGGFTVNSGDALANLGRFALQTVPGTPSEKSIASPDSKLQGLSTVATGAGALTASERMFVSTFGMTRQTYKQQPGLRICSSPCSASAINALLASDPNRVIWVEGDLSLDANIGSGTDPVLLIIDGDELTLSGGVEILGLVYLAADAATLHLPSAATSVRGALLAAGSLTTQYASGGATGSELTITYDRPALDLLRHTYGSWVRLGGSWRDFKASP